MNRIGENIMEILKYNKESADMIASKLLGRKNADERRLQSVVDDILKNIREKGDEALFEYTERRNR